MMIRENPKEKLTFLEVKFKDFFNGQKILIEKSRAWLLKNTLVFAFSKIAFGFSTQWLKIIQNVAFQKVAKMDHYWHFYLTFVHSKCKCSSLRSQCWMRLFGQFSNTVFESSSWYSGKCIILNDDYQGHITKGVSLIFTTIYCCSFKVSVYKVYK